MIGVLGGIASGKSEVARLIPAVAGVPSSLGYTAGASLAPGEYSLKLAIAEGDRVGQGEDLGVPGGGEDERGLDGVGADDRGAVRSGPGHAGTR